MRKLREVLRLRCELHLGYQQIGRSRAIGVSTVCKYLKRADAAGITWPLQEGWDDAHVEAALFRRTVSPALKPLPSESFDMSEWSKAKVNIDYHVAFDANLYSVPYNLAHETVEIRATPTTVEILHKGVRVASHVCSRSRGKAITNHEHRLRVTRLIGNGRRRGCSLGANHRAEYCTTVRADHGRQARWVIVPAWDLSGWPKSTRRPAWKPPPNGPC